MATGSVRVNILGEELSIKGDVDPDTTRRVAEYVDAKIRELRDKGGSGDRYRFAVLTALNIAGELFDLKSKSEEQRAQIAELENRLEMINRKMDLAL